MNTIKKLSTKEMKSAFKGLGVDTLSLSINFAFQTVVHGNVSELVGSGNKSEVGRSFKMLDRKVLPYIAIKFDIVNATYIYDKEKAIKISTDQLDVITSFTVDKDLGNVIVSFEDFASAVSKRIYEDDIFASRYADKIQSDKDDKKKEREIASKTDLGLAKKAKITAKNLNKKFDEISPSIFGASLTGLTANKLKAFECELSKAIAIKVILQNDLVEDDTQLTVTEQAAQLLKNEDQAVNQ